MIDTLHLIIEFFGCDKEILSRSNTIKNIFEESVKKAGLNKIKSHFHQFNPYGVTGFVLLRESHLSVHTWPEEEYAAIDAFTCGDDKKAFLAVELLASKLKPNRIIVREVKRGKTTNKTKMVEKNFNHMDDFVFEKEIMTKKTRFQTIEVTEHPVFGKILRLDKEMQISSYDEAKYSQPFVSEAFNLKPNAKKVAILGNGDCGVLREVLTKTVEQVYLIEIDKNVIETAKKYFPEVVGSSLSDKRTKLVLQDCFKFLEKQKDFDMIFIDLTTAPITKETDPYIRLIELSKNSLSQNGLLAVQSGFSESTEDSAISDLLKKHFRHTSRKTADVVSFFGLWAFNYAYN